MNPLPNKPQINPPKRIKILNESAKKFQFLLFWEPRQAGPYFWAFLLTFCISTLAVTFFLLATESLSWWLFFSLPALLVSYPLVRVFQFLFNRTIITIDTEEEELVILRFPFSLRPKQSIPLWSISNIHVEKPKKAEGTYKVVLETSTGPFILAETIDEVHSHFVKEELSGTFREFRTVEITDTKKGSPSSKIEEEDNDPIF